MPFTPSSSSILGSGGAVVASDLTVDGSTVTVDETNNRLGVNTDTPLGTVGVDGDLYFQPTTISTSHIYTAGSLDIRCTDNLKIGTDGADSVKIGRTNTGAAKCHVRSGGENDLVVSNSMVGIGTDSPDHTLSVAGDIDLTGGLSFDGGTAVTSIDTDLSSVSGSNDTLASAKAIGAQLDTKSPVAGSSSIVTVGALDSGSITSGFSSIDVGGGAITTTGAVGTGPITTALSSTTGILINQDYSDTNAATVVGLDVDIDKTGASTSDNTMIGVNVDMDNTTSTGGANTMTGIKVTPTCTQASGTGGTFSVKGMEVVATGSTAPENSTVRALDLIATGGDYTQGILIETDDANGWDMKILSSATVADFCTIKTVANGATTIETVDGSGADADLTLTVDGSFDVTATSASIEADLTITGTTPKLTIGDAGTEDTLLVFDGAAVDYRIGLDDGTDTLEIGKGAAHGTDAVIKIDSGANLIQLVNSAPADTKYSGTIAVFQAGEDLEIGEVVYLKPADGKVWKAVATAEATSRAIAMCTVDVAADGYAAFLLEGFLRADTNFPTYTVGGTLYTPEAETGGKNVPEQTAPDTAGDFVQIIGWARDANTCYVRFDSTIVGL